jgi:hypothetical protein
MQSDFLMLAVTASDDLCIVRAETSYSQGSVDCFDKDALKEKYPNISEEALIFLIGFKCATSSKSSSAMKKEIVSNGCNPSAMISRPDSGLALPPPKRYTRSSRSAFE